MTPITPNLARRLRERLARREPATETDAAAQRAAVAVVVSTDSDPALLFVKRSERAGDPWSGHVAFPGGFAGPGETSSVATAARETEEETGLALQATGECLGPLDDVYPRSVRLPRVIVTPVVFVVPGRPEVTPTSEVEQAVWVPVAAVLDPANRRPYVLEWGDSSVVFDSIVVEGLTIWGLTERILVQFAALACPE